MSQWRELGDRIAGKWQLPLLVVSLAMLAGAAIRLRPTPEKMTVEEAVDYLDDLLAVGLDEEAIRGAKIQLDLEGRTRREMGPIHLRRARALYAVATRKTHPRGVPVALAEEIQTHYEHADAAGQTLTPDDVEHLGRAAEWRGRRDESVALYEHAIDMGVSTAADLRRHVYVLRRGLGASDEELNAALDDVLAAVGTDRLDLRLWALEEKLDVLDRLDAIATAATMLARDKDDFSASDLHDGFEFLEALLLYKTGRFDDAERFLRTLRNRIETHDELYAKTGWLLGRVVLEDAGPQRPEESLSFFRDVIDLHPRTRWAVASWVGTGNAMVALERHDQAVEAYRHALDGLRSLEYSRPVDPDALRVALGTLADERQKMRNPRAAVAYAEMAVALVDPTAVDLLTVHLQQLADAQIDLGHELEEQAGDLEASGSPDATSVRMARRNAALAAVDTLLDVARINTLNEQTGSQALWQAGELCALAPDRVRASELFEQFARERPEDSLTPRALLRVGQLNEDLARLERATDAYQQCYRLFPRTIEGARALIGISRTYLRRGSQYEELAEQTLAFVLDDPEAFTPDAPEFAEAMFMLGDVVHRRGDYEMAITVLEESIERYPDHPSIPQARLLRADSYRQSGLALKREASEARHAGEIRRMRDEARDRLDHGRALYRELLTKYEGRDPAALSRLERMYQRHAYMYEADCLFENQRYKEALKLYEEAAATYKGTPTALAAHVQVINCHVFLEAPQEAQAALVRARILVDAIPDEGFEASISPETRDDWHRYFDWLEESDLF